ncbi:hypothetical protein AB3662_28930 [Sorangium cellulosum]|uniref:hypothetical protein n=1 Tax=Sorangium cellulosum TaxID=56 RepID=UPI003D9A5ADD
MFNAWSEIHRDDDPFDPKLLTPPPFCFQTPGDPAWHVTGAEKGNRMPGCYIPRKGTTWRPACGDRQVPVQAIPVQRQPTCDACIQAVIDARNSRLVDGVLQP